MGRLSPITEAEVVPLHGAKGPGLDEVGLAAWIAQAEPGEALVYHRGFLAVDATSVISKLPADRQRTLQLVAAARRAAEQNLVHLVQSRLGPDAFSYIAVAHPKPGRPDRIWRVLEHSVPAARALDDFGDVTAVGIDETAARLGHNYITLFHDLEAGRLFFACEGRSAGTVKTFAEDLRTHCGNPEAIMAACIDMSQAYIAGVGRHGPPHVGRCLIASHASSAARLTLAAVDRLVHHADHPRDERRKLSSQSGREAERTRATATKGNIRRNRPSFTLRDKPLACRGPTVQVTLSRPRSLILIVALISTRLSRYTKNVFQIHGIDAEGAVVLKRKLRRGQVLDFFAHRDPCLVGMEACAGAHFWARELTALGHQVRIMPPSYVKPHVKRGKTDQADAEAICEAATRPTMRFVPVKLAERQAALLDRKTRVRPLSRTDRVRGLHQGAQPPCCRSDAAYMAATDHLPEQYRALASREPSIHGPSNDGKRSMTARLFRRRSTRCAHRHDRDSHGAARAGRGLRGGGSLLRRVFRHPRRADRHLARSP